MTRWLVVYYDGERDQAKVVNNCPPGKPPADSRLRNALREQFDARVNVAGDVEFPKPVIIHSVVGIPDYEQLEVYIDGQEVIPEEIEL